MDADRQRVVVDRPQVAEYQFGNRARVDEDNGQLVRADQLINALCRVAPIVPRPRDTPVGHQNIDHRLDTGIADDELNAARIGVGREPALIRLRVGDRRRQPDATQPRCDHLQPRQRQRQQVTAFGCREGMDLVDDDGAQAVKHPRRIGIADQQRQRLGRGQQDLRRVIALALLAVRRRIAGPRLDPDIDSHFGDRFEQVARDIDRQRLQR